jgi:hypothetical protein
LQRPEVPPLLGGADEADDRGDGASHRQQRLMQSSKRFVSSMLPQPFVHHAPTFSQPALSFRSSIFFVQV